MLSRQNAFCADESTTVDDILQTLFNAKPNQEQQKQQQQQQAAHITESRSNVSSPVAYPPVTQALVPALLPAVANVNTTSYVLVDMGTDDIHCYDGTGFYEIDEPKRYMSGYMIHMKRTCFLSTGVTCNYSKVSEGAFNRNGEDILIIGDPKLCHAFIHIASCLTAMVQCYIPHMKNVQAYQYLQDRCFVKLSPNVKLYNRNKEIVPYNSATFWSGEQHYQLKFLIQVYGAFVYNSSGSTGGGGGEKLKLSMKVVQIQMHELSEDFTTFYPSVLDTCLM